MDIINNDTESPEEKKKRRAAERRKKRQEEKLLSRDSLSTENIPPRDSYLFERWSKENADQWKERREVPPSVILKDIPEQERIASKIIDTLNTKDNVILEAPTGWGKTGLAYQVYKATKEKGLRVLILNHANVLINQYKELIEMNLKDESISLMGKSNYRCFKKPDETVDKCECKSCRFRKSSKDDCGDPTWKILNSPIDCEYYWRREQIDLRNLVISNYHQMLSLINIDPNSFVKYDLLICDECHNIERILVDYATVIMSDEIVNKLEGWISKLKENNDEDWNFYLHKLKDYIDNIRLDVRDIDSANYSELTEHFYNTLESITNTIDGFYENEDKCKNIKQSGLESLVQEYIRDLCNSYELYRALCEAGQQSNYLYEESNNENLKTVKLVPLEVNSIFRYYLSFIADKTVLMSATVINPTNLMADLGLDPDKTEYIELDSKVPTANRPIYSLNNCKISIKDSDYEFSEDFKHLIDNILNILRNHSKYDHSGFIYCNSYKLCNMIYKHIANKTDYTIFINKDSSESKTVLQDFLNTDIKKRLLISCSFAEGVNFNDDISRFQIIPKVPYLFLGSKRVSTKNLMNNRWYTNKTIEQVIQIAGRSVRSENDFATTYILDKTFNRAFDKYKEDYPSWFRDAIIKL